MSAFLKLLGVERDEVRMVGCLWFLGFLLGATLTIFTTSATALYLKEFDSSALPYLYIGGAAITVSVGILFSWLGNRISERVMLTVYLIFMAAAVWLLLLATSATWSLAAGFLVIDVVFSFSIIVRSGFSLNLLTVRQSKRLGGIIGTGLVAGTSLAGLSMGLLNGWLGATHLILLSSLLLGIACLLAFGVGSLFRENF